MSVNALEIARRKELLGFTNHHAELLAACRDVIADEVEPLVENFYVRQTAVDEIALIIGDAETLGRLKGAMTRYITDLFSGFYDEEYVNNRLRIGLVHKRIGVSPKYYLSAMHLLKSLLLDVLAKHMSKHPEREKLVQALDKLLYFDNQFVFDTYIRGMLAEIETAKNEAVEHALSLEEKVAERTKELEEFSRKDPLTSLYNQRHFIEALRQELTRGKRTKKAVCLVYLDLDGFKLINDQNGHLAGDDVLRRVGNALLSVCRSYDVASRYGGDEFCAMLPDTEIPGATEFVNRLTETLLTGEHPIHMSVGVVQAGPDFWPDTNSMIRQAD